MGYYLTTNTKKKAKFHHVELLVRRYCRNPSNTHCPPAGTEKRGYLGGEVRVARREAGHDPDVASSYQAQGARFLQDVPVEQQAQ